MKIVRNYKGLKKWAKTVFVALMTVCIIFTSTGVASLIAYAEPEDQTGTGTGDTTGGGSTEGTSGTAAGTGTGTGDTTGDVVTGQGLCTNGGDHNYVITGYGSYDGAGQHAVYYQCSVCGADKTEYESCTYTGYAPYDDDRHYRVCEVEECGSTIPEDHNWVLTGCVSNGDGTHQAAYTCACGESRTVDREECTYDINGVCTACGYDQADADAMTDDTVSLRGIANNIVLLGSRSPGDFGTWEYYEQKLFQTPPQVLAESFTYTGKPIEVMNGGVSVQPLAEIGFNGHSKTFIRFETVRFFLDSDTPGNKIAEKTNFPLPLSNDADLGKISLNKDVGTYKIGIYLKYWLQQEMAYKTIQDTVEDTSTNYGIYYTVNIVPADINNCTQVTTGGPSAITALENPNVTVLKLNDYNLVKDKDYTIEYIDGQYSAFPESGETYQVKLNGKGNFKGSKIIGIQTASVDVKYNGKKESEYVSEAANNGTTWDRTFKESVTLAPDTAGYTVSLNPERGFKSSVIYDYVGANQEINLFFRDKDGVVITKTLTDITITGFPIKYDGKEKKELSYTNKVDISADGYLIGTSADGPFDDTYPHTKVGADQSFYLYFLDKNNLAGKPEKRLITGITIVEGEKPTGTSTGTIAVGEYKSDGIAGTTDTVFMSRELEEIVITAENEKVGISKIEYATADDAYYSTSDLEGAVTDGKIKWKSYNNASKPRIPANKASYIYARITDANGDYTYLSTGKVIHDNLAPVITDAMLTEKPQDNTQTADTSNSGTTATLTTANKSGSNGNTNKNTEHLLVVTGKDTLVGIDKFYMVYEEKTKDSKVPSVDEVIEKGAVAEVEVRDGENAAASFPLSGLYSDKTYNFHIVAVDKLGNKSLIKTITTKGKGASSKDVSGNSIDNGSGGSGLAPAPNGIAGSGGGNTPAGGTAAQSGKSGLTPAANGIAGSGSGSALDREINRKPYISDATGDTKIGLEATGGWDKITHEVTEAQEETGIEVDMAGLSVVPDSVLGAIRGRDISVRFKLPQGVEWEVNGRDIEAVSDADLDLGVVIGARNIPFDMLDAVTGSYPHIEIELKHTGPLGFTGKLRVPLGESNSNMYAYLYYYDTEASEMVLMQSARVDAAGYAEFDFDHASDYTIVLRADEMMTGGAAPDADVQAADAAALTGADPSAPDVAYSTFTMNDAVGSRASVRIWLFAVAIISALLCGAILFMPGLQRPETA
ncbi:MAG: hypothetical protein IKS16_05135 [Lachnospiraceae bacterium]|nr:hypothetical protein [Lachnospiraceae bacterium]